MDHTVPKELPVWRRRKKTETTCRKTKRLSTDRPSSSSFSLTAKFLSGDVKKNVLKQIHYLQSVSLLGNTTDGSRIGLVVTIKERHLLRFRDPLIRLEPVPCITVPNKVRTPDRRRTRSPHSVGVGKESCVGVESGGSGDGKVCYQRRKRGETGHIPSRL